MSDGLRHPNDLEVYATSAAAAWRRLKAQADELEAIVRDVAADPTYNEEEPDSGEHDRLLPRVRCTGVA